MTFFFFLPSMLLSGFMFPFRGMPEWAQAIGEVLPLTRTSCASCAAYASRATGWPTSGRTCGRSCCSRPWCWRSELALSPDAGLMGANAPRSFDAVVVGAGAAGLFCAALAGQRGLKVLLVDHGASMAEERSASPAAAAANFTNRDLDARAPQRHFIGEQPAFLPLGAVALHAAANSSTWCSATASPSTRSTRASCSATARRSRSSTCCWPNARRAASRIGSPAASARSPWSETGGYRIDTARGAVRRAARGDRHRRACRFRRSAPAISATASRAQFGLRVVAPRPALVPLTFDGEAWAPYAAAGRAGAAGARSRPARKKRAHRVPRRPAVHPPRPVAARRCCRSRATGARARRSRIDLAPDVDVGAALARGQGAVAQAASPTNSPTLVPSRLADAWVGRTPALAAPDQRGRRQGAGRAGRAHRALGASRPAAPKATARPKSRPAASTRATCRRRPWNRSSRGLYFIGEVVDVTGWLGGYNFQWAWASAHRLRPGAGGRTAEPRPAL